MIYDARSEELPVVLDWDGWNDANSRDRTLSGVRDKFGARNLKFIMKDN